MEERLEVRSREARALRQRRQRERLGRLEPAVGFGVCFSVWVGPGDFVVRIRTPQHHYHNHTQNQTHPSNASSTMACKGAQAAS